MIKRNKLILIVIAVALVCVVGCEKHFNGIETKRFIRCGDIEISKTGIVRLGAYSKQYIIVPEDKYPAELSNVSLIDHENDIYIARFFKPAGIGVDSFYDVCFQVKSKRVFCQVILDAASIERTGQSTYVRSCSYVFDSPAAKLFLCGSNGTGTKVITINSPAKQYSESP